MASVRPIQPLRKPPRPAAALPPAVAEPAPKPSKSVRQRLALATRPAPPPPAPLPKAKAPHQNTLDSSWDRKLTRGIVIPDSSIDLHGHTLSSAHALLDQGLDRAIRRGDRVLLLVTGKPPRPESERPHARGAIRAAVADWIGASRHADAIAAVRGAHPRHGGMGALYIVLRRPRGE